MDYEIRAVFRVSDDADMEGVLAEQLHNYLVSLMDAVDPVISVDQIPEPPDAEIFEFPKKVK